MCSSNLRAGTSFFPCKSEVSAACSGRPRSACRASRVAGASWWTTYRRIVLRLMAPTLMAVAMITFVGAARNISNFALLSTSASRPLSILQLDYVAQRKFEEAVVVACIIMFISLAGALAARLLGLRGGSVG